MEDIAAYVRGIRRRTNLSQYELAYRVGVQPSTVCRWETDKTTPGARNLLRLGKIEAEVRAERAVCGTPMDVLTGTSRRI